MKVIKSEENALEFDNGLRIDGVHSQDCCEYNYLDFEQLPIGTELEDMTIGSLIDLIKLKKDGFIIKDKIGTPLWVQARSFQNGYYSDGMDMKISKGEISVKLKNLNNDPYDELFKGAPGDWDE